MDRYLSLLIIIIYCISCSQEVSRNDNKDLEIVRNDSINGLEHISSSIPGLDDTTNFDYASYYILIADTGREYVSLNKNMFVLNRELNIPIDTMGRSYHVVKDLIALPDIDEDELYAGNYFPRRFPSEHLSLEYLDFYTENAGDKTIALVAGIYEAERSADSALAVLHSVNQNAFKIKAKVFIGCMH